MKDMRKFTIPALLLATLVASCGGGSDLQGSGTGAGSISGSGTGTGTGSGSGSGSGTGTGTGTGSGTSTYTLGSGSGSTFMPNVIAVSNSSLSAGASTTLTASVVDKTGTLYTGQNITVTFSSQCLSTGLATIAPTGSSTAGTATGQIISATGAVQATYTAKGCTGSDVITAETTINNVVLTPATGTVTVQSAAVGSIQFESATPTTIGLKGTGLNDTSTVIFKVVDSSGGPRSGVTVNFALSTNAGGLSISPLSAVSAADGTVQTVVSSGVQHTTVRVTASIASPALSAESSQLTVSTGLPTSKSFTLSLGLPTYPAPVNTLQTTPNCPNVEAYTLFTTTVPVTASLSDRYGNPVPDGTAVAFQTDGGTITPQCTTTGGQCTVTWTATDPVPTTSGAAPIPPSVLNGRAVILATAIGEESFTDLNGSGYYVAGDPFVNLGEPFLDVNESGSYVTGDPFYNYYNGATYEGPASPAVFKGIVCTGDTPSSTCTSTPLGIGAQHLLIMSASYANVTIVSGALDKTHGYTLQFAVTDTNGNPMASGTTISASVSSTYGTLSGSGTQFTTSCACFPADNNGLCPTTSTLSPSTPLILSLTLSPPTVTTTINGVATINVTTPGSKITSSFSVPVSVSP
jgi:hypothetical protein